MTKIFSGLLILAVLAVLFWQQSGDAPRTDPAQQDGYLVLALSWTPSWCAVTGRDRGDERCAAGSGAGWLVHGLWPQFETGGWPEFCDTPQPAPSRAETAAMMDIMGSEGLALHQWRKHGTCSGLAPEGYFTQTRAAFAAVTLPEGISSAAGRARSAPDDLMTAFRAANPEISEDMAILTCREGMVQEIRVCLSTDLTPQRCDSDLLSRGCRARNVDLPALP
ncbi:ribonuclease T2 family protein [Natronohydrobacter thiooxidans]|uniref:ribonuclease T2 family protein n=1 Tax=Natronohydrobacter thiooxidans TaxID=87172 RepID=UPI0009FD6323|nr:ribonuclease T2 [Natronohydrobacter thiooxidans]